MIQIVNAGGKIQVVETPEPALRPGGALVRTSHSLISVGTESASLGGGGSENLLVKAVRNPHLVRKVIDRALSHGVMETANLVRSRISSEMAIGYSCSGVVLETAPGLDGFQAGDRVACAGAGYANHAEVNFVPKNLMAKLPDAVTHEEGAFATLGAIALQGVRRVRPELGERIVVVGLGLLGQLTVQLLKIAGAVVIGVDVRRDRVERALGFDMDAGFTVAERDFQRGIAERTQGWGADAVIVTASGGDAQLLNQCFEACRRKGRVVLVGDVPIKIAREKIYKKELDFKISTSYGPGRYDGDYEEKGLDYPYAYVRWTEGRNIAEVCRLIGADRLAVRPLIDQVHAAAEAEKAYASLGSEPKPIGVLLSYPMEVGPETPRIRVHPPAAVVSRSDDGRFGVGVIGYGGYFRSVLQPLLVKHQGFRLVSVCSRDGLTVRGAVQRREFEKGTTDHREILEDAAVDVVYVTTRHDRHFPLARAALESGKAVFVEKPMTMTEEEGLELLELVRERRGLLTVGFNRRFSPLAMRMKELLAPIAARKTMIYRINAGPLPREHWLRDPEQGGGRILGEGVHFVDFLCFMAGSRPVRWFRESPPDDCLNEGSITLAFADGSTGVVVYTGQGVADAGKERVEVFAGGTAMVLDDFKALTVAGGPREVRRSRTVDKGQPQQLDNFFQALRGEGELGVTAEDGYWATRCAIGSWGGDGER